MTGLNTKGGQRHQQQPAHGGTRERPEDHGRREPLILTTIDLIEFVFVW